MSNTENKLFYKGIYALYPQVVVIRGEVAYDVDENVVDYDVDTVNAWVDPDAYKDNRVAEYPNIGDQLDMIWHLIDSGGTLDKTSDFYTSIKVVKDAHPKS